MNLFFSKTKGFIVRFWGFLWLLFDFRDWNFLPFWYSGVPVSAEQIPMSTGYPYLPEWQNDGNRVRTNEFRLRDRSLFASVDFSCLYNDDARWSCDWIRLLGEVNPTRVFNFFPVFFSEIFFREVAVLSPVVRSSYSWSTLLTSMASFFTAKDRSSWTSFRSGIPPTRAQLNFSCA